MSSLACTHVMAGYDPRRPVIEGVTFAVSGGELVVLLGPNGSGKTTLLRVLTGVLSPQSGQVTMDGIPLTRFSCRERARRIAVVSQRTRAPALPVRDVVLMGRYAHLAWHSGYGRADLRAADAAMELSGTVSLANRLADTLSGGEWQRVLWARALVQGADIFVLDEPASGLDPARLVDLFDQLEAQRVAGSLVLAVLHDINAAALYATRLIGLRSGRVYFDGAPGEVFTSTNLEELYGVSACIFTHPELAGTPQMCLLPGVAVRHASGNAGAGAGSDAGDSSGCSHADG